MASRLAICDDAPGFRLLAEALFSHAGFDVVGTATSWPDAEHLVAETRPDALLLDLWLPTFDLEALSRVIVAAAGGAFVAVVSSLSREETREKVAGVNGIDLVLSKRDPPESLAPAVREGLG